ncbi:MAG: AraC family transcriptional regulator [Pseudomonadota bacterium]
MRSSESTSVHFARAVLANCPRHGIDTTELLRRNRLSPRLLKADGARISIERFANLQVSTMLAMGDEALGYLERRIPIGAWSMMCHAVIGSETLGQAMSRYCRFFQLFDTGMQPQLITGPETSSISLGPLDVNSALRAYGIEMTLFNAHRFASWLIEEFMPLSQVRLHSAQEAEPADYRHMFLANPVDFEAGESALVFSTALLERRVVQDEKSLRHFLRHPLLILLSQRYEQDSWTTRVRDHLRRHIEDMPELVETAGAMELHPQTLRRRLSAEGASFKELKSQVRRDAALYLLGKHGLSIEEIAHRSGFSESSAFIRAFKGWTGMTPYSYRKGI